MQSHVDAIQSEDEPRNSYVYALGHPDFGLFYIGKGKGTRLRAHELEALDSDRETAKLDILRKLQAEGKTPTRFLVTSGLTADEAYNLESILIAFCRELQSAGLQPSLTNVASGHGGKGFMLRDQLIDLQNVEEADLGNRKMLLLSINATYDPAVDYTTTLPSHVAGRWVLNQARAASCEYVIACVQRQIVGVYRPTKWLEATVDADKRKRFAFQGEPAADEFGMSLLHKGLPSEVGFGVGNPVAYYPR